MLVAVQKGQTYWTSNVPAGCQLTGGAFNGVMFDARTSNGQWGLLCTQTFEDLECRLGIGLGQRYERQADGRWLCTAGLEE